MRSSGPWKHSTIIPSGNVSSITILCKLGYHGLDGQPVLSLLYFPLLFSEESVVAEWEWRSIWTGKSILHALGNHILVTNLGLGCQF